MTEPYPVLQEALIFQEDIKKSRFITYLQPVTGKEQALAYLHRIREQHKEARHHCWAYIGGSPKDSVNIGCSDDGEPKGTAGKPMLAVLQGCGAGEIMAVVVRYSGGIKLGTGGLVRAYSNGIQQLVKQMQTIEKRFYQHYQLHCDYAQMALIESLLVRLSGRIVQIDYLQFISAVVEVDLQLTEEFTQQLESLTQGKVFAKKIPNKAG
nr:YigZ family protein [Psychromonas ossibalaenae]